MPVWRRLWFGVEFVDVKDNSINENAKCIIDWTDVWCYVAMQLQNNNPYSKIENGRT